MGIASQEFPKTEKCIGWEKNSFGYHSDDGNKYGEKGQGSSYSETFETGDIIGCLYDLEKQEISFTKNGISLGVAFTKIDKQVNFYPSLTTVNCLYTGRIYNGRSIYRTMVSKGISLTKNLRKKK